MFLFSLLDKLSYIILISKQLLLTEHLLNTVNTKCLRMFYCFVYSLFARVVVNNQFFVVGRSRERV